MSTFTIRVTSPATNAAGTSFNPATQQPDQGAPSFLDLIVTNSTDPLLPNGVYDAYCLTPLIDINLSPTTYSGTTNYPGNTVPSFDPSGSLVMTQLQTDRINWLLAQNLTSDPKFGGQFNYGEVQTAIWKINGFTDAQIIAAGQTPFLNDGGNNVVSSADIDFLVSQSAIAIASGNGVLPTDAFFTTFIDPTGNVQPLIIQLQSARLGDYVWFDGNGNGLQDSNEAGVDNVVVELYDGSGNFISSTKTGDDFSTAAVEHGYYQFTGLKAGNYQVKFIAPTSYQFTTKDANGNAQDAADSDAHVTSGFSHVVTLPPGGSNQTIDAGLVQPASLGDRLWFDSNANGQQDDGATGISGQTVTLIGGGADGLINGVGDTTAITTTGTDGFYEFTGLTPGVEYQVQFAAPAGTVFTGQNVGNDTSDSDADTTTGKTQIVTLGSGEHNPTLDAGVYVPASLGDRLWLDSNANGQQDDGATGISGQTVTLIGGGTDGLIATAGDNTTATTTTGTDGFYQFTGLKPGVEYQVQFAAPAGTVFTGQNVGNDASDSDADTTTGKTQIVTLGSGEHNPTLDAGVILVTPKIDIEKTTNGPSNSNATAPDYDNEDAANGAGVPVLTPGSSVTWTYKVTNTGNVAFAKNDVAIVDDNGTTGNTADDLSVANGKITYQSGDTNTNNLLDPGEAWLYKATGTVQNLTAAGAATTFDFSGSSATDGSDGNVRTFTSGALSVKTSAFSRDQSTGTWAQAYLGSYGGGLGVTDSSESGSGDTHTVDNLGGRDNYVLFEFNQNVVVDSAFLGYVVGDSDMSVWIGTRSDPFNNHDTMLSDADLTALGFTEVNLTDLSSTRLADLNAGNVSGNVLVISGWTGDTTPEDRFKIENLTVRQSSPGVYENKATVTAPGATSDSDLSHYKNPAAQPILASLGDRVWEDLNANGVQDTGENGISGVTVKLLNSSDGTVATTTTNASGNYLFSNLTPGDYKVQVVAPTGYYVSPKDQGGNDATDSDIDSTTGKTVLTTLISGENDLSWDAGLYRKASVGDKVWDDMDHDNVQDASEPGIKGITVKLMNAAGTTVLATTTTNSSGNYLFSNLDPGTYVLQFDKTNVQHYNYGQWNNMSNWKWAVKDTGSNDSIDSDVAGDAIATTNVTKTSAFTLVSGQNDLTRDAGITPIAIDLDGNGIQTVSRADSGGSFDLFGNGGAVASGWLSGGDGFLAVDKNGNGKVDSISELFGGTAKGAGFAQLAEYDSNGDGLVNAADAAFADLRIWRDANGNHQTDDGELMTLAEAGVSELATAYTELPFLDRQGNVHLERSSATMSDGQTVDMTDVYFSVAAQDAAAAGVTLTGIAELLNANGGQTPVDAGWLFS